MIYSRPLKKILGKTVPFGQFETINPINLGSGERDGSKFLKDDGTWDVVSQDGYCGYSHTGAFAGKPLDNNYVW